MPTSKGRRLTPQEAAAAEASMRELYINSLVDGLVRHKGTPLEAEATKLFESAGSPDELEALKRFRKL